MYGFSWFFGFVDRGGRSRGYCDTAREIVEIYNADVVPVSSYRLESRVSKFSSVPRSWLVSQFLA